MSPAADVLARSGRTDPASFEARYRLEADPWGFASSLYEREKYARTLGALNDLLTFSRALELGCANGELTALLAARCRTLVALDAAPSAVTRARARCADAPGVEVIEATLPEQLPRGPWELVVASEILYYLGAELLDGLLDRLTRDLVPGGLILAVHWRGQAATHASAADDVHARLRGHRRLRGLVRETHPGYLLDLLEREP